MATTTNGGTTASLSNTPQANDDYYCSDEGLVRYFDVMLNDLGGSAKTLWSIDDTSDDGATDLVCKDVAGVCEYSELGAKISLTADGKIRYDSGASSLLNSLAAGAKAYDQFTYAIRLANGTLSWATVTVEITGTNDGPVANLDTGSAGENEDKVFSVLANDTDVDDGAVLSLASIDGVMVDGVAANAGEEAAFSIVGNQIQFAPGSAFDHLADGDTATVVITYTMTDEHGATSTSTLTITVAGSNDGPVANADNETTSENAAILVDVLANDTDADDGHTLTVVSVSAPAGQGSASVVGNQVQFDPASDFDHLAKGDSVTVTISYTVEDEHGASSSSTVDIIVTGTNDTPVAVADEDEVDEDASISGSVATNDDDADDGAVLTYALVDPAPEGLTFNPDGSWSFDASSYDSIPAGEELVLVIPYTVTDEHLASDSSMLTITITGINDAPVSANGSNSTDEDTPLNGNLPAASDVDGDSIAYALDSNAANGNAVVNADGSFSYTPDPDFNGTDSFSFTVSDGNGGSNTYTYEVTVNPVNDAPVSANGSNSTDEDTPLNGNLPAASDVDGDSIAYALDSNAANGNAVVNADGSFSYTPDPDFNGTDSFSFTVSDGNGGSNTYTYEVTVNPVNDAAVITGDDSGTIFEDAASNTVIGNLDSTDVDNDDDSWNAVLSSTLSDNGYGTYTVDASGNWVYTLDNSNTDVDELNIGDTLPDSFTVYSQDGTPQVVTITIEGTNDLPFVSGDLLGDVTEAGSSNGGGVPTVTGTATADDVDNPDNVFQAASGASALGYGSYSIDADGNWTYTLDNDDPDVDELGSGDTLEDHFQIYSDDGTVTQVTITIHGANDAIVLPPVYAGDDDPNNFDTKNDQDSGTNLVTGTEGNDLTLNGNNNANTIRALGGDDTVNAGGGGDTVYGGSGADTINGGSGNDFLYGQAGDDIIHGDDNNDTIYGGSGNDQIFGDENSDQTLFGGSGNDTISGGDNTDRIVGGFGADELSGGANSDTFVFLDVRDTGDTITDYTPGPDTLDFTAIDANPFAVGDQQFLWGGTDATAHGMWFAQVGSDTILYADTDGNAATAEFVLTLENFSGFADYSDPGNPPPMTWIVI